MGKLLAYSGVATKLRAISSRLFTREEYLELGGSRNVTEALNYLRQHPAYEQVFAGYEGAELHREQIEGILDQSIGIDFQKIYRFCSARQRRFLDMYFQKYEVTVLKQCLGRIFDHRDVTIDLSYFKDFFSHHSRLKPEQLSECKDIPTLLAALQGTGYEKCLAKVQERPGSTLWDYATALDYEYFLNFWKERKKYLKGQELDMVTEMYGVKMELLNIQWIARGKKYYNMSPAQLTAVMLPVGVHMHRLELRRMTEASTMKELEELLAESYYGRHYPGLDTDHLEEMYIRIRREIQHRLVQSEPYSIAVMISYLFDKEHEIDQLTSILECVRYGLDAEAALVV